jgi:protein-L-isoaspartate(D-aspartate) O-methyltransferase
MATSRTSSKFPLRLDQVAAAGKRLAAAGAQAVGPVAHEAARAVLRPQAPLQHAVDFQQRLLLPTGLGLDSADVRRRMVDRLRQAGLANEQVLAAMARVERHRFVDPALVIQAYEDTSLPIGHGQTISKPSVVGRMIEMLMDAPSAKAKGHLGRVLEIGTGCGYQAAVLAEMATFVVSIERLKPLHDKARLNLGDLRRDRIRLIYGDGMLGHPPLAPYDCIIAAAGGQALPQPWLEQLAVGGRLVAPLEHVGPDGRARQSLVVVERTDQGLTHAVHEAVRFVPLKSGTVR